MPEIRERRARRVLERMIAVTPPSARPPWRTRQSISRIGDLIADGVPEGDLIEHVEGAAELVRRGLQRAHWWSVGNVFGEKTIERWRGDIGAMYERDRINAAERAAEAARAAEYSASIATPSPVANMQLARWAQKARATLEQRWSAEQEAERQKAKADGE